MSTKPLGTLQVILSATADKMTAGLSTAKRSLQSFDNAITASVGKFGALTAALGGGISVAGLTALTKSQAEVIDSAAKMSDRLGIATEALIGLQHAGNLAGADTELMNKSLEKMAKNVAIAATAGGPAADAFKAIGLDAEKLSGQNIDQTFLQIADGIKAIENPYQRAKVAAEIFGKAGGDLLPTLMAGSEAIRQTAAETEKYGTAVNRISAAKVEAANDAFTRVGEVIKGVGSQLAVQLAPYIEAAANWFIELTTAGGGFGAVISTALDAATTALSWIADGVQVAIEGFQFLSDAVTEAGSAIAEILAPAFDVVYEYASTALSAVGELTMSVLRSASEALQSFGVDAEGAIGSAIETLVERFSKANGVIDVLKISFYTLQQAVTSVLGSIAEYLAGWVKSAEGLFARFGLNIGDGMSEGLKAFAEEAQKASAAIGEKIDKGFAAPTAGRQVTKFLEDIKTKADDAAKDVAKSNAALSRPSLEFAIQAAALKEDRGVKAATTAKTEFSKTLERSPIGAIEAGSREAYTAIREAQDSANGRSSAEEKNIELNREANRLLAEIAKKEPRVEVANF